MKHLLTRQRKILGIDITSQATQLVQIRHHNNTSSLDGYTAIPHNILKPTSTGALADAFDNPIYGQFDPTSIVVSLPKESTQELLVAPQKLSTYSPERALKQAAGEYQKDKRDKWHAYQLSHDLYCIVIVPQDIHQALQDILAHYHLPDAVIRPRIPMYYRHLNTLPSATILLDIHNTSTTMCIPLDDTLLLQDISFSLNTVISTLMHELGISEKQAHHVLFTSGLEDTKLGHTLRSILDDQLLHITQAIEETIDRYYEDFRPSQITITLTGPFAAVPGIDTYMQSALNSQVSILNPWASASPYPLKPMPRKRWPQYTHAIELALNH